MSLCRLIYCSKKKTSDRGHHQQDILLITNISRINNAADGITGALLSSPSHFFQILEGKFDKVTSTMSRIRKDVRHERVELLQFIPIKQRNFGGWDMAVVDLQAPNGSLTAALFNRVHAGERQFVSVLETTAFKLLYQGSLIRTDAPSRACRAT